MPKKTTASPGDLVRIDGNFIPQATPDDRATLRTRKSYSPAAVEDAIRGLYGLAEWRPAYNAMTVHLK
jgi:hypothetical protein